MTNPDHPIFPLPLEHISDGMTVAQTTGLTKREHFGAIFTAAMISKTNSSYAKWGDAADDGLSLADAYIAALNKEGGAQ